MKAEVVTTSVAAVALLAHQPSKQYEQRAYQEERQRQQRRTSASSPRVGHACLCSALTVFGRRGGLAASLLYPAMEETLCGFAFSQRTPSHAGA